jgi:AAA ATPase domain
MDNPADVALQRLKEIIQEFSSFLSQKGKASEADTRVKLVDRVLKEVCGWPEGNLSREDHVESGYTDYQLSLAGQPYVVVEAKREGVSFVLPHSPAIRSLSLDGTLITDPHVKAAVNQVRQYCDDAGIKFAITTNGYSWIIFRAIRDDIPWRKGRARVFASMNEISEHFVDFWNLLSYQAISAAGSLESEFGRLTTSSRKLDRVIDRLFNADLPLRRNRLNSQLQPVIKYIFEDIAGQDDPDLLQSCYVHTGSLYIVAEDLNLVITDTIPKDSVFTGTKPLKQTSDDVGEFGEEVKLAVKERKGELYLLLGGIGSGKTTFLKRYQTLIAKNFLEANAFTFHLDFLKAPLQTSEMEPFVWSTILEIIRDQYAEEDLEHRKYIKSIFKDKLKNLEVTALRGIERHTEKYEQAIGPYLLTWQENLSEYVPNLLRLASVVNKKATVLFIDNVDQLDPEYQAQIFLLAQRVTRMAATISIIALREESYYAPSIQNSFTAYTSHKFHIASPQFRPMIRNRIEYAIRALESGEAKIAGVVRRGNNSDVKDICEFLRIVEYGVLVWSRKIARFVECICFGNMRSALEMFTTFLTSGATDVDKMLVICRNYGSYYVSFHEFLKSVMLQDRAYYKEDQSPILNLFNCTSERNSSHFTGLRVLKLLLHHRGETSPQGKGYVDLGRVVGFFAETFDDVRDIIVTLDRLVNKQLIEVNTRATHTVSGASHIRVTAAGWYYLRYLSETFAYLDLVLQDTPLNDGNLEKAVRQSVYDVNNLADKEQEKYDRMQVRFNRTLWFLDYLAQEEKRDFEIFNLQRAPAPLSDLFMPRIINTFRKDREYIERRIREANVEETPDEIDEESEKELQEFLPGLDANEKES